MPVQYTFDVSVTVNPAQDGGVLRELASEDRRILHGRRRRR